MMLTEDVIRSFANSIQGFLWLRTPEQFLYVTEVFDRVWGMNREEIYENAESLFCGGSRRGRGGEGSQCDRGDRPSMVPPRRRSASSVPTATYA